MASASGSVRYHLKIGVRHSLDHQVPGILIGELSGTLALLKRPIILPLVVIEDGEGGRSAEIGVMKRADDGGNGNAGNAEAEANCLQVELFNGLAYAAANLRQESAQRPQPLTAGGLAGGATDEQTQVGLQAAIDRVTESQGQRRGGGGTGWDAALELALLASQRGGEQKSEAKGDPITPIRETFLNSCQWHSLPIQSSSTIFPK